MTHPSDMSLQSPRIARPQLPSRGRQRSDETWLVIAAGDFGQAIIQALRAVRKDDLRFLHVSDALDVRLRAADTIHPTAFVVDSAPRLMPAVPVLLLGDKASLRSAATEIQTVIEQVGQGRDVWCFALTPDVELDESTTFESGDTPSPVSPRLIFVLADRYCRLGRANLDSQVELTAQLLRRGLVPVLFDFARHHRPRMVRASQGTDAGARVSPVECPVIRLGASGVWLPDESPGELAVRMELLRLVTSSIDDSPQQEQPVEELLPDRLLDELGTRSRQLLASYPNAKLQWLADVADEDFTVLAQPLGDAFRSMFETRLLERLSEPGGFQSVTTALSGVEPRLEAIAGDLQQRTPAIREQAKQLEQVVESLRLSQSSFDIIFRRWRRRRIQKALQEQSRHQRALLLAVASGRVCAVILKQAVRNVRMIAIRLATWHNHASVIATENRHLLRPTSRNLVAAIKPVEWEQTLLTALDNDHRELVRQQYQKAWATAMRTCVCELEASDKEMSATWETFAAAIADRPRRVGTSSAPLRAARALTNDSLIRSLLRERAEPVARGLPSEWVSHELILNSIRPAQSAESQADDVDSASLLSDQLPALLCLQIPVAPSGARHPYRELPSASAAHTGADVTVTATPPRAFPSKAVAVSEPRVASEPAIR